MERTDLAAAIAYGRIALGATALLTPGVTSRAMLGGEGGGGASLFARMLGGRDIALGLGVVLALRRGAPIRGWLEASALVDGLDFAACVAGRDHMPGVAFAGAAGSAAGASLVGAWLARELDERQPRRA